MTVASIKKYRGAHILIANEWQSFYYVIFFKGQFYGLQEFRITKRSEYTSREYIQALDATLTAAKATVDSIIERSLWGKFISLFNVRSKSKHLSPGGSVGPAEEGAEASRSQGLAEAKGA